MAANPPSTAAQPFQATLTQCESTLNTRFQAVPAEVRNNRREWMEAVVIAYQKNMELQQSGSTSFVGIRRDPETGRPWFYETDHMTAAPVSAFTPPAGMPAEQVTIVRRHLTAMQNAFESVGPNDQISLPGGATRKSREVLYGLFSHQCNQYLNGWEIVPDPANGTFTVREKRSGSAGTGNPS
jgi:hypothetical protein